MRGSDGYNESLFSTVRLEDFVPVSHPLRPIRNWMNETLSRMYGRFAAMDEAGVTGGRPSIAPEKLVRAMLLQVLYSLGLPLRVVRSSRHTKKSAMDEGRSTAAGTLWVEIYGDYAIRNHSIRYAGKLATEGNLVRFGTYAHSIKAPARGVPHCADLPFLFGTYGLHFYRDKVGAGAAEANLSASMQAALVSFARDVSSAAINGFTPWPRYTADGSASVLFGAGDSGNLVIAPVPKTAQLAIWD